MAVTVTAQWSLVSYVKNFDYTGGQQTYTIPYTGYYKLEVWGGQGGSHSTSSGTMLQGGYGGYSYGNINLNKNSTLYLSIGGAGGATANLRGYNGGGYGTLFTQPETGAYGIGSGGGGATHIAKRSGLLKNLSSYTSDILIVAGGGGGVDEDSHIGGNGGGNTGGNGSGSWHGNGGTQTNGGSSSCSKTGSFGQGADAGSATGWGGWGYGSGAGGGFYGGGGGCPHNGHSNTGAGGGGSGYIGNSLLLASKGMYQHSTGCVASSSAATKTICTATTGSHIQNAANIGNGYARITWLGDII